MPVDLRKCGRIEKGDGHHQGGREYAGADGWRVGKFYPQRRDDPFHRDGAPGPVRNQSRCGPTRFAAGEFKIAATGRYRPAAASGGDSMTFRELSIPKKVVAISMIISGSA